MEMKVKDGKKDQVNSIYEGEIVKLSRAHFGKS
jgi:hypothetical protein